MATAKTKAKILDAFVQLLGERGYGEATLTRLAEAAGLKLSQVREAYPSKNALVEAFAARIDQTVLDDLDEDMEDQPPRDRLFDILMARIDALAPFKDSVGALREAARSDTALALELSRIEARSMRWMLEGAKIHLNGVKAAAIPRALAYAFSRVVDVWLEEDDEGMPRTMVALDQELDRGSAVMSNLKRAEKLAGKLGRLLRRTASRRRSRSSATQEAAMD